MLDLLIAAYILHEIMPIELRKVQSQEPQCLGSKTTTVPLEWTVLKTVDACLLHFYCIRNKYIVWKCVYTIYSE